MFKYSFLFLICFFLFSCKQQQKATGSSISEQESELIFSLKTTPCYGECPVFDLMLYSDSTLVFEGKQFTKLEGNHEKRLNPRQYEALTNLVSNVDWGNLNENYESDMTDLPSSQFFYNNNGSPKNVFKYGQEPQSLSVLGEAILSFVQSDVFDEE